MKIRLQQTKHIPKELEPGVLYVSEEFQFAAHLCACGCGSKIRTPLGSTEWDVTETSSGPSLYPSIGNWQQKCQSHYWIRRGEVVWAPKWTPEEIAAGRQQEEDRRRDYYEALEHKRINLARRFWNWLKGIFGR